MGRKYWVRVTAAVMMASLLGGCATEKSAETGAESTAKQEQTSGDKRVVTIWYDGTEADSVNRLEPEFEKLHPDIDLQFEIIPYKDLATKEMVACQAKVGPDLMWQSYAWTNSFAKRFAAVL